MSDETHVLDLLPAYALGSLEADEVRYVEEHLRNCSTCRAKANDWQTLAEQLSFATPIAIPPSNLRKRLMQRIQTVRSQQQPPPARPAKQPRMQQLFPIWGLTSLCLIIALAVVNLSLWQRLNHLEFMTAPGGMWAVPLNGASGATGFLLIGADGMNGALVVDRLPPLQDDQKYQVWLTSDGQTVSGALFSTDEESYGWARIHVDKSIFEYSTIDVTIEPSEGSLRPTGTKVLDGLLIRLKFLLTPSG